MNEKKGLKHKVNITKKRYIENKPTLVIFSKHKENGNKKPISKSKIIKSIAIR
jgi:hypothetical protein